jgi:spore coat protein U-like protein
MTQVRIINSTIALAGAAAALLLPAAALAATATGHASVTIVAAIAVSEIAPMDFGTVGVTKAGGSVVLSPTGTRSGPATYSFDGASRPGQFTVAGTPNAAVAISFSSGDAVNGPGPAMALGSFTHNAGRAPALNSAGSLSLAVGATVTVGAQQPYGSYAGTYTVTVNY